MWPIRQTTSRTILTPTSGFIREAGFTHSLSPARNCTYGCTYCYVPTLGIYAGLTAEEAKHWGQFTTFKANAPDLLERSKMSSAVIYCSPLVDPYQPVERDYEMMPRLLESLLRHPPSVFTLQTRGPLVLRDLELLKELSRKTRLRISMSITTDDDSVRKRYEPHCESNAVRLEAVAALREHGLEVYATLAPLLPCDPERLAELAIRASQRTLIGDPLHVRQTKRYGATSRAVALDLATSRGDLEWFNPEFQRDVVRRIAFTAKDYGFDFEVGPSGFSVLANCA